MVVVGPETVVFVVADGLCSCGALADARIDVRRVRYERRESAFSAAATMTVIEYARAEPQCYCCRDCGLWALGEADKRRRNVGAA